MSGCYERMCYEWGCFERVYYAKMYVCVCLCMCVYVCMYVCDNSLSPAVDAIVLLADVDHGRCQIHPNQRSLLLLVSDRHAGPYRHCC